MASIVSLRIGELSPVRSASAREARATHGDAPMLVRHRGRVHVQSVRWEQKRK